MISLEKAKALRESGLVWEPKEGDCISRCYNPGLSGEYRALIYLNKDDVEEYEECRGDIWLPRLDQLLGEIEKRGWSWDIQIIKPLPLDPPQVYRCEVWRIGAGNYKQCDANTTEDTVADALIWILMKGGLPMGD